MRPDPALAACQDCLCLASRRAARGITRLFERQLRPHGIRATQFTALVMLRLRGPLTVGALAKAIGVERTTLTRNLARLDSQGWVRIAGGAEDARARIVALTAKGRAIIAAALPDWQKAQRRTLDVLGERGAEALRELARKPIR